MSRKSPALHRRIHLGGAGWPATRDHRLPKRRRAAGRRGPTEGFRMPALISRKPQRAFAVTALVVASMIGGGVWLVQSGHSAAAPDISVVKASRGDVVVSVGGVGRIVTGGGAIDLPASGGPGRARADRAARTSEARPRRRRVPSSRAWLGTWPDCSSSRGSTSRRGSRSRGSMTTAHWPQQSIRRSSISRRLASSSARSCTTTRRGAFRRRRRRSRRRATPSPRLAPTWPRRPAGRTRPT